MTPETSIEWQNDRMRKCCIAIANASKLGCKFEAYSFDCGQLPIEYVLQKLFNWLILIVHDETKTKKN